MTKPLTLRNREDKGDVDPRSADSFPQKWNARFPSYFDDFCIFSRFLALSMRAALTKRRPRREHKITPAAANMAIV
jgi:hypothetical protein